jgi:signal transduction histidine kinase
MQEPDDADLLRLREGLRDFVALPVLVAELADVLVGSLRFDFAFVRLSGPDGAGAAEAMRGSAETKLPEWLEDRVATNVPLLGQEVVPDIGDDSRGVIVPVATGGEGGVIAVASARSDFPNSADQLLLSLGANHAAAALKVAERTAELERSEWYLAEAQRLTSAGSVALDVPTWEVLHSSAEHSRLYGFDPDGEVPSLEDFSERIHPDDRSIPSDALARGVREGATAEAEYRVVLPNAEERRFLAIAHPVFDASGRIDQFMCTVMDVTERRRGESELARLASEQAALRRVATLVARETQPEQICAAVAEEVGRMLGVDQTTLSHFEEDGTVTCLACWGQLADAVPGGAPSAIATPIVVDGRLWGEIVATSMRERLPADSEDRLGEFTELVATAIANVDARSRLQESRARIVEAADEQRRRVVRDLHDGAQQRLVHAVLTLTEASRRDDLTPGTQLLVDEALTHARSAIDELRELVHGIHPAILTKGGLAAAARMLADRAPLPVQVAIPEERYPAAVESAAYFVAAEAMTNVAKYARASRARIEATRGPSGLRLVIEDDGVGGAELEPGSGLAGLADRVEALDGVLAIDSAPGAGTRITAEFPVHILR